MNMHVKPDPLQAVSTKQARRSLFARIAIPLVWLGLTLLLLALLGAGLAAHYVQLLTVTEQRDFSLGQLNAADVAALNALGWSVTTYAIYLSVIELLLSLITVGLGAIIFWRRADDRFARFVSLALPYYMVLSLPLGTALSALGGIWGILPELLRAIAMAALIVFFFTFPDGRFVPRWTRALVLVWLLYTVLWLWDPSLAPPRGMVRLANPRELVAGIWLLLWVLAAGYAQVYRFRRVSTASQRQQTKWAVLGFAVMGICAAVGIAVVVVSSLNETGAPAIGFRILGATIVLISISILPLSLTVSILRSHLWDIDVLIRRTATYSLLTVLLVAIYFSMVILLQRALAALTGQSRNEVVTVISTLAIAALFVPLRASIQNMIDRRFYRRKYDAQKVLERFAATARDETSLDRLTGELVGVVNETMQPASASVWLNDPATSGTRRP